MHRHVPSQRRGVPPSVPLRLLLNLECVSFSFLLREYCKRLFNSSNFLKESPLKNLVAILFLVAFITGASGDLCCTTLRRKMDADQPNVDVPETTGKPEKKMRTLRVRRAHHATKARKQVVLARKVRPGEELTGPMANRGSPSRTKVNRGSSSLKYINDFP